MFAGNRDIFVDTGLILDWIADDPRRHPRSSLAAAALSYRRFSIGNNSPRAAVVFSGRHGVGHRSCVAGIGRALVFPERAPPYADALPDLAGPGRRALR